MWHRLYYHIVWTTRDRQHLIDAGLARFLCRFLRGVARQERAHILEIGMVETHVHVLVRAHPTTDISRLLNQDRGASVVGSRARVPAISTRKTPHRRDQGLGRRPARIRNRPAGAMAGL